MYYACNILMCMPYVSWCCVQCYRARRITNCYSISPSLQYIMETKLFSTGPEYSIGKNINKSLCGLFYDHYSIHAECITYGTAQKRIH
jgi:hypothetical protein